MDAETAHHQTIRAVKLAGLVLGSKALGLLLGGRERSYERGSFGAPELHGLPIEFGSRLGLAAGFDKNCEILEFLPNLGFGFAEIGTVTPRGQAGNLRPRLARNLDSKCIFNRMGFNNLGAEIVARRLSQKKGMLPALFRVGVNVGKNFDTPVEDAARDYELAIRPFQGLADYLVVNVSSPNTIGLRSLQTLEGLKAILGKMADEVGKWKIKPPIFLKLAPELCGPPLIDLISGLESWNHLAQDPLLSGWVLTNTQMGKFDLGKGELPGGWSGAVLTEPSMRSLREVRSVSQKTIISVGGVMSVQDGIQRVLAGADLIQIYSGWVFNGPRFPFRIRRAVDGLAV